MHAKNLQSSKDKPESSKSGGKKTKPSDKCKGPDMTIAVVDRSKSRNIEDNKGLCRGGGKWCPIHRSNQHDFDECYVFKKKLDEKIKANAERGNKQAKSNIEGNEAQFNEANHSLAHIFGGSTTYEFKMQYMAIE